MRRGAASGRTAFLVGLCLSSCFAAREARASPPAQNQLFGEATLLGVYQPTGALLTLDLKFRRQLYVSKSEAFQDNYAGIGLLSESLPTATHNGLIAEIAPAAFVSISLGYERVDYFGDFNYLHGFSDCAPPLTSADRDTRCNFNMPLTPLSAGTSDHGHRFFGNLTLQAKVGRLAAVDTFGLERWAFRSDWKLAPNEYWLNALYTVPQKRIDTVTTNWGLLLWEAIAAATPEELDLRVGLSDRLTYVHGTDYLMHRVGFMALASWARWQKLDNAAILLITEWYTNDRYFVNGVPFLALGLTCATPNLL